MPQVEQAFVLEFRISFGDSVMADHKFFGQGADSGQFVPVLKNASFDTVTDLLDKLQVERLASGWIQFEDQDLLYHC